MSVVQVMPYPKPISSGGPFTITVASGKVAADLSSFPMYLDLADLGSGFWSSVSSDGGNIRVSTDIDPTVTAAFLPFDVANIDTGSSAGRLYFKASLSSGSDNLFYLHLVGGASLPAVGDALGRNAVWSNYTRVYDGWENADRPGAGSALTLLGNANFTGGNIVFDGGADGSYTSVSQPTDLSFFMVLKYTGTTGQNQGFMGYASSWSASPSRIGALLRNSAGNAFSAWNNTNSYMQSSTVAVANTDYTVAYTHDTGTQRELFLDGVSIISNGSAVAPASGTPVLTIGCEDSSLFEELKGEVALAIYADRIMTDAEIAAIHDNWRTAFYSIS